MVLMRKLVLIAHIVVSIILIVSILLRTTSDEGLTGVIGGTMEAAIRVRGIEDQLDKVSKWSAFGFLITSFLLSTMGVF